MNYNLSELVNSDKDIELPQIIERLSSQRKYQKVLRKILRETGEVISDSLLTLYTLSLADEQSYTTETITLAVLLMLSRSTARAITEAEAIVLAEAGYLDNKFVAVIKRVTGVDVSAYVRAGDNTNLLRNIVERNTALITDLSEQTRSKITQAVIDAQIKASNSNELKAELKAILGKQAKRADLIATDQLEKLSADIIADRAEQAGLNVYIWQSLLDGRERSYHGYLHGKRQDTSNPNHGDKGRFPRQPIRCRCWAKWIIRAFKKATKK